MPMPAAGPGTERSAEPWQALWQALGLDPAQLSEAEMAELAGQVAKAVVSLAEGLVVTLGARRMVKDTLRMDQTQLRSQGNNPFKFASSGAAALRHFMGADRDGFLPLADAVAEAFSDIQAHELAAMMATQMMVGTLLDELGPRRIEEATPAQGLLSRRPDKSRLWDTYIEEHARRAGNVAGTAQAMLATAFAKAYEHQAAEKKDRGP